MYGQDGRKAAPAPPRSEGALSSFLKQPQILSGERIRKSGDEFDQISLTPSAGLFEQVLEVELDRVLSHAERFGHLGRTADLDNGEQHPQFARRQLERLCDDLGRRGRVQ